jgi:hypothetical protein
MAKVSIFAALRPRHRRFVEEYAKDWNATAAYKRTRHRAPTLRGSERLPVAPTSGRGGRLRGDARGATCGDPERDGTSAASANPDSGLGWLTPQGLRR